MEISRATWKWKKYTRLERATSAISQKFGRFQANATNQFSDMTLLLFNLITFELDLKCRVALDSKKKKKDVNS